MLGIWGREDIFMGVSEPSDDLDPDCLLLVFPNGTDKFDVNYKDLSSAISEFSKLDLISLLNQLNY